MTARPDAPELSAAERERVNRIEGAPVAVESWEATVERMAAAMKDATLDQGCTVVGYEIRTPMTAVGILSGCDARRLASVALAVVRGETT